MWAGWCSASSYGDPVRYTLDWYGSNKFHRKMFAIAGARTFGVLCSVHQEITHHWYLNDFDETHIFLGMKSICPCCPSPSMPGDHNRTLSRTAREPNGFPTSCSIKVAS